MRHHYHGGHVGVDELIDYQVNGVSANQVVHNVGRRLSVELVFGPVIACLIDFCLLGGDAKVTPQLLPA